MIRFLYEHDMGWCDDHQVWAEPDYSDENWKEMNLPGSWESNGIKDFYEGTETDDYLQITLTDEEDVPDGMAKLRTVYPNLMQLVYDNSRTRQSRQVEVTEHVEQKSEMELFEEFYEIQNNQQMSEEQRDFVRELMEELVH